MKKTQLAPLLLALLLLPSVACSNTKKLPLESEAILLPTESIELHHRLLQEYKERQIGTEDSLYPSLYEKNKDGIRNPYIEFIFEKDIQGGEFKGNLQEYLKLNPDQSEDYYSLWCVLYLHEIGIPMIENEGTRIEAETNRLKVTGTRATIESIQALFSPKQK